MHGEYIRKPLAYNVVIQACMEFSFRPARLTLNDYYDPLHSSTSGRCTRIRLGPHTLTNVVEHIPCLDEYTIRDWQCLLLIRLPTLNGLIYFMLLRYEFPLISKVLVQAVLHYSYITQDSSMILFSKSFSRLPEASILHWEQ